MPAGVSFACAEGTSVDAVVAALHAELAGEAPTLVMVFHARTLDPAGMAQAARAAWPGAHTVGCTTHNEYWGGAFHDDSAVAVAFVGGARAAVEVVPDMGAFRPDHGAALVGRLASGLDLAPAAVRADQHLLITLTDGLCGGDERLLHSLTRALPGVSQVGGNAGDGTRFEQTFIWVDGRVQSGGGAVVLLEPGVPFRAFAAHHFRPTGDRVVVTEADPARRRIIAIDGWPALVAYGRLLGTDVQVGTALGGNDVQFGMPSGDGWFMRSVMAAAEDGLVVAGGVGEGEILHVMAPGDMVASTRHALDRVFDDLPEQGRRLLLFHCGGRHLAALAEDREAQLGRAMAPVPAVGFSTYGEHFDGQLVNLTLSGLAFALAGADEEEGFALLESDDG